MQIDKITIQNFRGFKNEEFFLDPRFTVAIGDNGAGKSSLLYAMQIVTGSFFLGLPDVQRRHIHPDELRLSYNSTSKQWVTHTPVFVEAEGEMNSVTSLSWRREIAKPGQSTSSKLADIGAIKKVAERYAEQLNIEDRPIMPVIAFFGIQQLGSPVFRRSRTKTKRMIIRDGYYNALGPKSDNSSYISWIYYYEQNLRDGLEFEGTYEAFFEAIEKAVPYLSNITFDRIQLQLVADCAIPGQEKRKLPQNIMSDGLKRILGIVADIAYRCVILNGFKGREAILRSTGVVMIDELDMHLHPKWQRHIVANLKDAFPGIQFIATTHSPFIVQSLNAHELINLDKVSDVSPDELPLDDVAVDLMGVDSPFSVKNQEEYQEAKDILAAVKTGTRAQLDEKLSQVSNPGLRAFLELNKMASGK